MWYCKFLDLPKIPESICQEILLKNYSRPLRDYKGWSHIKNGREIVSADNPFYHSDEELTTWINNNILNDYNDLGIRHARYAEGKTTTGIHTDQTRKYVLQYLLKSGGGVLNFWKELNSEIVRNGRVTLANYDSVELLESFNLPENSWVLLNATILHSVEYLCADRISVQISLNYDPYDTPKDINN